MNMNSNGLVLGNDLGFKLLGILQFKQREISSMNISIVAGGLVEITTKSYMYASDADKMLTLFSHYGLVDLDPKWDLVKFCKTGNGYV